MPTLKNLFPIFGIKPTANCTIGRRLWEEAELFPFPPNSNSSLDITRLSPDGPLILLIIVPPFISTDNS